MERVNTRHDGTEHETIALDYLERCGLELVARNFHYGTLGEIDLVMRDQNTWVFVEVKCRRSYRFGRPEDAVTPAKQRNIRRVAEGFLHRWKLTQQSARFDVVAVDYVTGSAGKPEIRHLVDAFH
jgi:putative endonuclease